MKRRGSHFLNTNESTHPDPYDLKYITQQSINKTAQRSSFSIMHLRLVTPLAQTLEIQYHLASSRQKGGPSCVDIVIIKYYVLLSITCII